MKRTIYLVRHAQYDNPRNILVGRLPVQLSDQGVAESQKLRDFFSSKNISKIYSSEVMRCKQTSDIISAGKIPIEFDTRLLETFSAFQGYWEYDWAHFFKYTETLGGEVPEDIYKRVSDFWNDLTRNKITESDGNIIICSHGDPLYLLYVFLAKKEIPDTIQIYDVPIEDYQPKASVRPIVLQGGELDIKNILPNTDLS